MNLLDLRKQANLTQHQVADMVGLTESGYCLIEQGKRTPRPKTAKRLGQVLKFDWTALYEREGGDETSDDETSF